MDCYAYALLAAGQIDLVIEAGLHAYDVQAPIAVIEAAGGIVTDWQGGPAHDGGRVLAAANPVIHAQALDLLDRARLPAGRPAPASSPLAAVRRRCLDGLHAVTGMARCRNPDPRRATPS